MTEPGPAGRGVSRPRHGQGARRARLAAAHRCEVSAVLARYGRPGGAARGELAQPPAHVGRGPGPVRRRGGVRQAAPLTVRTAGQLAAEHALAAHLRALGVSVPAVLRLDGRGATTVGCGDYVYEVHTLAPRDRPVPGHDVVVAVHQPGPRPGGRRGAGPVSPGQRGFRPAGTAAGGTDQLLRGYHRIRPPRGGGPAGGPAARPGQLPGPAAVAGGPHPVPPARDRPPSRRCSLTWAGCGGTATGIPPTSPGPRRPPAPTLPP